MPGTHCWPLATLWGRVVIPGSFTVGGLFSLAARAFLEHKTSAHRLISAFSGQVPQVPDLSEFFPFLIPQWLPAAIRHSHWSIRKKEQCCSQVKTFIVVLGFSEVTNNMGIQVARGGNISPTLRFLQGLFKFYPWRGSSLLNGCKPPAFVTQWNLLTHSSQSSPEDD